jgi:hypothetical protein
LLNDVLRRRRRDDILKSERALSDSALLHGYRGIGEEEGEDRGEASDTLIIDEAVRVATDPNSQNPKRSSGERE